MMAAYALRPLLLYLHAFSSAWDGSSGGGRRFVAQVMVAGRPAPLWCWCGRVTKKVPTSNVKDVKGRFAVKRQRRTSPICRLTCILLIVLGSTCTCTSKFVEKSSLARKNKKSSLPVLQ